MRFRIYKRTCHSIDDDFAFRRIYFGFIPGRLQGRHGRGANALGWSHHRDVVAFIQRQWGIHSDIEAPLWRQV